MQKVKGFGKRLYYSILDRDMTQAATSRLIDIDQRALSYYVNDKALPNSANLYKICVGLNVSADYLLGLTKDFTGRKVVEINAKG